MEKLFFKRVLFLPAPAAPPKGMDRKTPLGQLWQQKMVVFRKALFKRALYLPATAAPKTERVIASGHILGKCFVKFSILWVFKPLFLCYNV
ncbi:hypothetical protein [uncultured Ruminococcus sp.]|uniref:hypothetical protein n=1 Tax=uncultured Ruminococcus sp. TaxID=165186 RepID=UPI0029302950|nr:hypothetical protein [uncultured Ruminococcus sp.]